MRHDLSEWLALLSMALVFLGKALLPIIAAFLVAVADKVGEKVGDKIKDDPGDP